MTKTVNRLQFLQKLDSVKAGVSLKMTVNQSNCVVFDRGRAVTFDKEVACRIKSGLPKDYTGAVPYGPLTKMIAKLPNDKIDIQLGKKGLFIIRTDNEVKFRVRMESGILLPVGAIERPTEWHKLHRNYCDVIGTVHNCASMDNEASFTLTCVHTTPKYVEATDRYQAIRFKIKSGFQSSFLMKQIAVERLIGLEMNEYAETDKWVHFRNPSGLMFSCQRHNEQWRDISEFFEPIKGKRLVFPKTLGEVADNAELVSKENKDSNLLLVKFTTNQMLVKAFGVSSDYTHPVKVKYKGKPFAVAMSPLMLKEIGERQADCVIDSKTRKIQIEGDRWTYVASLREPKFVERDVKEKSKEKVESNSEEEN